MPEAKMTPAQKLVAGERAVKGTTPIGDLAKEFGVSMSLIYDSMQRYRKANNLPVATIKKRRASLQEGLHAKSVAVAPEPSDGTVPALLNRLRAVEEERDAAIEEAEVLQRIVITLGRAL